ncbi:hypothetical protein GGR55DRAFT_306934 [Xylaria sp. FL0064]|nr:hypothetical protein GGR55DRAFT_306934 [Xylaria sp. FL0064]
MSSNPETNGNGGGGDGDDIRAQQLRLLGRRSSTDEVFELNTAPLFTYSVLEHARDLASSSSSSSSLMTPFSQYALLSGAMQTCELEVKDPRIFYSVATPSSVFSCGSQGSGKSHSLSCVLENCLIQSRVLGDLPHPLMGIVFHYDDYASDTHVTPCKTAYLGSDPNINVRVLCSPSNLKVIKSSYQDLGNVVEELRIDQADSNTKRMLELMAFERTQPLYAQVIQRILRDMRLDQQTKPDEAFDYHKFKRQLQAEQLSPDQKRGLQQRLDTLESFMVPNQVNRNLWEKYGKSERPGTDWAPKAGELLIVDLSCPSVSASMACALFNICLSIFLAQDSAMGRVIALDEAHRYMGEASDSDVLTNSLLAAIRYQRHLGTRIVISTQEPTISPKLLDLCSITIVHRFSSPDWLSVLAKHLAGVSRIARAISQTTQQQPEEYEEKKNTSHSGLFGVSLSPEDPVADLFQQIVGLRTGEALVFAPSAIMSLEKMDSEGKVKVTARKLAHHVLRVMTRARITADGGKSIMAS